jgi:hypothetical protein
LHSNTLLKTSILVDENHPPGTTGNFAVMAKGKKEDEGGKFCTDGKHHLHVLAY